MPQIGPLEILVVGVLALLVFGPEKLPEMARTVGKGVTQLKRMAADAKAEFDLGLDDASDEKADTAAPRRASTDVVTPPVPEAEAVASR